MPTYRDNSVKYAALRMKDCSQYCGKTANGYNADLRVERRREWRETDVLQLSGRLAGDVKESPNGNPTRDLQMAADRIRPHTLCGPVVSSLFSFAARC